MLFRSGQDTFRNTADIVSKTGKLTKKHLTVKIELHKVNPYKIWWLGEKTFTHKGQEETFVRFTIDQEGKQVGAFTYVEKKFVTPYAGIQERNEEPSGSTELNSGSEESHYSPDSRR